MPVYSYTSDDGDTIERYFPISEQPPSVVVDGVSFLRDVAADWGGRVKAPCPWPRWSDAAGVHPHQAKEASAECAKNGVKVDFCPETGRAKFESLTHQRAALKAMHMKDRSAYLD